MEKVTACESAGWKFPLASDTDVRSLARSLFAPFEVRRVAGASVAWLNDRYFYEAGVDVSTSSARQGVERWLVEQFAFCIPDPARGMDCGGGEARTFLADRYGSSGASPHGGSGRVGLWCNFQVKGVGPTPLVASGQSWSYSHGCVWMEEAIREAIYSEVVAAEFPHGAVPVIAIIDLGCHYIFPDGHAGERRALIVRPFVMRPAHMERATLFSRRNGCASLESQQSDVSRVGNAIAAWVAACECRPCRPPACCAERLVNRLADQVSFGRVHRLFHGGYFSSNVAVDGRLIDFGSFRAVPDWGRSFSTPFVPPFGYEAPLLRSMVESLTFCLRKYSGSDAVVPSKEHLLALLDAGLEVGWEAALRIATCNPDLPSSSIQLQEALSERYSAQQRASVHSLVESRWFGDQIMDLDSGCSDKSGVAIAELEELLGSETAKCLVGDALVRKRSIALLLKREGLFRERLQADIYRMLGEISGKVLVESVGSFIDDRLTRQRRFWPLMPARLSVIAQSVSRGCAAVICWDARLENCVLWLEGTHKDEKVILFGESFSVLDFEESACDTRTSRIGVLVQLRMSSLEGKCVASVLGRRIEMPGAWHSMTRCELAEVCMGGLPGCHGVGHAS